MRSRLGFHAPAVIPTSSATTRICGTDEYYFLNQPGQGDIQVELFYDYRTNVENYPKWQAWMRKNQLQLLIIWGKYESPFDPSEPESYRRDVPNAQVHIVDGGHFTADEAAQLVRNFVR